MSALLAAAVVVAAYLLGSVSGALLVGRLRGGVDIRTLGSGNAGGTNALRTQGPSFALAVLVIDLAKGWIAAALLPLAAVHYGAAHGGQIVPAWLPAACALAAIVGHVWPLWHGFRGGKGVATFAGVLVALAPAALAVVLGVWLVVVMLTGYVGLASMAGAAALPLYVAVAKLEPLGALLAFGIAAALLVIFTHRANVARMRAGTESRARRLWLLGPRR
ncbi:MAG: glycerol-3-phosphate 1-O-acyltransferase PlsY [Steroidobacteraceae bacterium]|nr:glycerol-3-phosphate 1-O-acyltransferase PlsY [Steroidobacteraceae bacterium]MCW5571738.1 glycerol-3-phosphate 1-O-acyltransferase PlsY [Steroidobacteraceae bacterium]